jgi:hypothetical protein
VIALLFLLTSAGGAFVGRWVGCFKAALGFGALLVSGLGAINWGLPLADVLSPSSNSTQSIILVLTCVTIFVVIISIAAALVPTNSRMPWLLDTGGGLMIGLLAGWLVGGFLIMSARLNPSVNNLIRASRPKGEFSLTCPDYFWLSMMAQASTGGLSQDPPRGFLIEDHFLSRSGPPGFDSKPTQE